MQSIQIAWPMQAAEVVITAGTTKPANSFISKGKNSAAKNAMIPKKKTTNLLYEKPFTAAVRFAIEI
jgi:hypothetical protein